MVTDSDSATKPDNTLPIIHCLGCGRAARTVLRLLYKANLVQVGSVVNRRLDSARSAVDFIGAGRPVDALPAMTGTEGLLLGVPETQLAAVSQSLAQLFDDGGRQPEFAFHLSASQSSNILQGVAPQLASCHPALAFADPGEAVRQFPGSWCVLEGHQSLVARLERWLTTIGAKVIAVAALNKRLYHAAAMSASNLMLGLLGMAETIAASAGLPPRQAHELLCELAARNLLQAGQRGTVQAFTGPMERGDATAVHRLMEAVDHAADIPAEAREIWPALLRLCLPLVEAKARLGDAELRALRATIDDYLTIRGR